MLNNIAKVYSELGDGKAALEYHKQAIARSIGLRDDASVLNNIAAVYSDLGNDQKATEYYNQALVASHQSGDFIIEATTRANLAVLYQKKGKYAQADLLFQRSLQTQEKALGREHPDVTRTLHNLANLRFAESQPELAQPLYARAFDNLTHQFEYYFTFMSETDRLRFLATVSGRFPLYFSFVHQFYGNKPDLAGSMYDLLLWEKGVIAGSETALRHKIEASGDERALKLLDQLSQKRAKIATRLDARPRHLTAWRKQIEQMKEEANDLERNLVALSASFAEQKNLERATWQQVRDALKPGEAAIEFARFHFYDGKKWTDTSYYVALMITSETKDHPAYIVLGDGKQLEGESLVEFQRSVQDDGADSRDEASADHVPPAVKAYDLYWKPLEPLLQGKTRVYLSLDGVLNQMPLGLMDTGDGKLLMEKYDLRLLCSTKDLLRQEAPSKNSMAVLVGNPSFGLSEAQQRAALQKLGKPQQSESVSAALAPGRRSRGQGSSELEPLPHTGAEVVAISNFLIQQHWQAPAYIKDSALKEVVKQARSPRILHLATHGFFLPDQQVKSDKLESDKPSGLEDPMLRSGLYFAGANRSLTHQQPSSDLDDGVLTAYEATGLNLQGTELVVLSACNTGQGQVQNGEGVFGLRRALQEAGAQAVMMSLWEVPDKATEELMTLFYSKWLGGGGMEKHEALRQAQLEMRGKTKQDHDGRDLPYFWGAFVLVGR